MEQRIYLVHQKPHSLKKRMKVVNKGGNPEIVETFVSGNKHTRRTFAGKYFPETKTLLIGIAGNHVNDPFVKSVGAEIAESRVEKVSNYLLSQKKQVLIKDVDPQQVGNKFFETVKTLEV